MEKIEAFSKATWIVAALVVIASREDAIKKATTLDPFLPVTFTDGSVQNDRLGIGMHWRGSIKWPEISRTISTPKTMDAHAAKPVAIDLAVSKLLYSIQCGGTGPPITIFTDSQGALQALRNLHARSGQFLLTQITLKVHEINTSNRSFVTLEWSPDHSHIPGNDRAHRLA